MSFHKDIFHMKENREFVARRCALQEMLKEVLQGLREMIPEENLDFQRWMKNARKGKYLVKRNWLLKPPTASKLLSLTSNTSHLHPTTYSSLAPLSFMRSTCELFKLPLELQLQAFTHAAPSIQNALPSIFYLHESCTQSCYNSRATLPSRPRLTAPASTVHFCVVILQGREQWTEIHCWKS